jgi:uncharacterized protein (DUF1697 family)
MSQQRYIALLGGINVGGHRVKMDHLRGLFEALGLLNVATFIASGNVIFETATDDVASLQTRIERHLTQELGYVVPTFIRSAQEFADIAWYQAFPAREIDDTPSTLSIMFLSEVLPVELHERFLSFSTAVDRFHIHGREIYWLCHGKITESLVTWTLLGKTISMPRVTVRNVTTVRKLAEKYAV